MLSRKSRHIVVAFWWSIQTRWIALVQAWWRFRDNSIRFACIRAQFAYCPLDLDYQRLNHKRYHASLQNCYSQKYWLSKVLRVELIHNNRSGISYILVIHIFCAQPLFPKINQIILYYVLFRNFGVWQILRTTAKKMRIENMAIKSTIDAMLKNGELEEIIENGRIKIRATHQGV